MQELQKDEFDKVLPLFHDATNRICFDKVGPCVSRCVRSDSRRPRCDDGADESDQGPGEFQ